ncbi:DJ-1/PfpI family protein [Parasulfuritortus cantonensis]|uniref:DJ-1/PfpI family protein n=1 Tax=Parasulfuritortus cantonensis TaxID=2528202 RepID=A0A4R1B1Z4_9PROT|nr:DJ-1 family glyoxalase III [Parasulfuritortus cantonensis]TCJ11831.1 DJ-1/PfpI family protein [Parasulfuritortus cantonensis]
MKSVLVPLAPGFEDLEAVTIVDLLRRADIEVVTAGLHSGLIRGSRGIRVQPDATLEGVLERDFDMIVLPGGMPGAENLTHDPRVQALLKKMAGAGKYTAAICAAPMALAQAGLLDGRRATSYPGFVDRLPIPGVRYSKDAVVVDDKLVTSRGPGTAMDFGLALIELLVGKAVRDQVETALVRS